MAMKNLHRQRPRMMIALAFLLLQLISSVDSASNSNDWMQVSSNIAFQRRNLAEETDPNKSLKMEGALEEAFHRLLSANPAYAASYQRTGQEWSSYQLAWRLLGFYIDCNANGNNGNNNNENKDGRNEGNQQCRRMVMYAVYVDVDYEGGGFDEYEYYDQGSGKFVCYSSNNNKGCREKMDCHLSDTNWKMLGVFKINQISQGDGWMEQLFKHEGVCVWGEDTYKFASQMREKLPNACKEAKEQDSSGNSLYYDVKPDKNATISVGLYSDDTCSLEYQGSGLNVYDIAGISEDDLNQFNKDLDTWKICQPCIAYSVSAANNDYYCYDEAGYENCNQCMKFSAKSGCQIASMRDISLADRQQTLVPFPMYGSMIGGESTSRMSASSASLAAAAAVTQGGVPFLKFCSIFFGVCFLMFVASSLRCKVVKRRSRKSKKEALLENDVGGDGIIKKVEKPSSHKKSKSPKAGRKSGRKSDPKSSSENKKGKKGSPTAAVAAAAVAMESAKQQQSHDIAREAPLIDLESKIPSDTMPRSTSTKVGSEAVSRSNSQLGTKAASTVETTAAADEAVLEPSENHRDDTPSTIESRDMPEESAPQEKAEVMTSILAAISKSMSFVAGTDELDEKEEPIHDVEDRMPEVVDTTANESKQAGSSGWMKSRVLKIFKAKRARADQSF